MNYYKNIQNLIEKDIVLRKKNRLIEENSKLITNYEIGKILVEAQGGEKHAKYGNDLINKWSKMLTEQYGKGYDASNLRRMRQLYLTFRICGTVSHKLSWSHYYTILSIKNENKRNYYINISIKQNLSVRDLRKKIKNQEYERLEFKEDVKLITNNQEVTLNDMIKNPILINTDKKIDKLSERALKQFILEKIEEFLLELGYGFNYTGSEVRLGKYKCDLLFFNTELNSYVVIELKIRELKHQDIGQIKYYMNYIDNNLRKGYMNKTIGLILCKENNQIVIKYITDERVFYSTYKLVN